MGAAGVNHSVRPGAGRSWLFVPGTRPDRFEKAQRSGADGVIFDLEDAVASADKDTARQNVLTHFSSGPGGPAATAVRMNVPSSPAGLADLQQLMAASIAPDFLIIPKCDSAAVVRILEGLLNGTRKHTLLIAQIETVQGLRAVEVIAQSGRRLHALLFGAADMSAELGCTNCWNALLYSRSRIIAACAGSGCVALDSPYFDLQDAPGLSREIRRSLELGFSGKAVVHPAQVASVNAGFTPSEAAVARARSIIAVAEQGVGVVDGQLVDEAMARQARRLLARVPTT